ncbi:MAG: uL13 family ribosomal protein [Candidatus Pacebacteria bacterium]|nr:uL13 family ribosomal protein [Candidatus Paceibacterota bacterium]
MKDTTTEVHIIDATGKRLGRVATEVSALLMGKHRTDAVRHMVAPIKVTVEHVSKLLISEKKRLQKEYDRYTGYPDGRRILSMEKMIDRKGYAELMRKAVYGMLPSNKLRAVRMKKLTISE